MKANKLVDGKIIQPSDFKLHDETVADNSGTFVSPLNLEFSLYSYKDAKNELLNSFSTAYLSHALKTHKGNVSVSAKKSGMERQAFQRLLKKYSLNSKDFR